ncbi:MAG TPA: rhomboid family intramembrane serine protease, partial [Bacteroidia bacterium]|nr:rhomboid family intramembrane serine protease [Bacteroidia bacterium]
MSVIADIKMGLRGTYGALIRLIIINVVVYLLANISASILELYGDRSGVETVSDFLALPSNVYHLVPRFWTIFTYMFVHFGLMHLLGNMLWLYFLGRVFSDLLGGARMTGTYIIGGLIGGIVYIAFDNSIPNGTNDALVGASAGVMAIVVAAAAYSPDYMMFPFGFAMKLKWLALISFILTSLIDLTQNTGGKVSHIGGAIFGWIYGAQLRSGKNFLEGFMKIFRYKSGKLRIEHSRSRKSSDEIYRENKINIRKQVDEILDKISRSGYDSLT